MPLKIFFKTLFTGITTETLSRLPYLGYSILLILLPLFFAVITVLAIGTGENLLGGNLQQAQDQLRSWFSIPFIIVGSLFALALLYITLNIMVKRIRDIGLPVMLTSVIVILLGIGAGFIFLPPSKVSGIIDLLIFIGLLVTPSNSFGKK